MMYLSVSIVHGQLSADGMQPELILLRWSAFTFISDSLGNASETAVQQRRHQRGKVAKTIVSYQVLMRYHFPYRPLSTQAK